MCGGGGGVVHLVFPPLPQTKPIAVAAWEVINLLTRTFQIGLLHTREMDAGGKAAPTLFGERARHSLQWDFSENTLGLRARAEFQFKG